MITQPPAGSRITVVKDGQEEIISIPPRLNSAMQFFMKFFLLFWVGGWAVGWVAAFMMLTTSNGGLGPKVFVLFWLCAWTVGGIFAIRTLRALWRSPVPESFRLRADGIAHDSGVSPPPIGTSSKDNQQFWRKLLKRRVLRDFSNTDMLSLKMRETEGTNRLTIDVGAERIDLAESASEVEREWLFEYLAKRYH